MCVDSCRPQMLLSGTCARDRQTHMRACALGLLLLDATTLQGVLSQHPAQPNMCTEHAPGLL
jgi:hypothetical protein